MAEKKSHIAVRPPSSTRAASERTADGATESVHSQDETFEHDAAMTLGELQHAVKAMLDAVSDDNRTVAQVEKAFGIDHKLGWQLYRIVKAKTPLAAGASVPARVSMERLLKAARRRIPAELVSAVSAAFERFERLVEDHAGDRETLEVMLSAYLPEVREKQELAGKEAAFRGMAQVRGVTVETDANARILHPSIEGGSRDDCAILCASLGVRRIQPNAHLEFGSGDFTGNRQDLLTIERKPARKPDDFLLRQFSSLPLPRFEAQEFVNEMCYSLAGSDMGLRTSVDLVTAEYRPGLVRRAQETDGKRYSLFASFVTVPTKRMVSDLFLHQDIYAGIAPQLRIYDIMVRGLVTSFEDPSRERDRLWMQESIVPIAGGMSHARLTQVPRYGKMLEHVCGKLGWNPAEFRGYRLDVQYPVYGAVYAVGFALPEGPGK